jgi:lipoate-protein ligase A
MAADEAMLAAHARGETPATLRFYRWRPAAVSMGRFQKVESALDLDACRALGVEVVRRPTGGRAILHEESEITFSVVIAEAALGATGVMASYAVLARGIVAGLRRLGVQARLVEKGGERRVVPSAPDPMCFAAKARCDVEVGGRKIVGSAQVHRGGVILQQNSLPIAVDLGRCGRVFGADPSVPSGMAHTATDLQTALGRAVAPGEVIAAFSEGFAHALDLRLVPGDLTEAERAEAFALSETRRVEFAG